MNKALLLTVTLVAGATPALWAQDGFRVGASVGSMKTTGPTTPFAMIIATSGSTQTAPTYTYGQPTQTPLSLDLALVKGDDEFSLTYMASSKKDGRDLYDAAGGIRIGGAIGGSNSDTAHGRQELKVSTLDLAWKRTFVKGEAGSLAFSTGLRAFELTDEFTTEGTTTGTLDLGIHAKGKATGFGLTAGLHARLNLSNQVWVTTGFTLAQLNTTQKAEDYRIYNNTNTYLLPSEDTHGSNLQTESYLRLNMAFVKGFNGYLGYEVKNFGNDAVKIDNLYTQIGMPAPHGFGLSGFTLGLSYTF